MTPNRPTDPTDQRDFSALLDAFAVAVADCEANPHADASIDLAADEARAAVVARFERETRIRGSLSNKVKELTAELAAERQRGEAQAIACREHRACCGAEHDPVNGKLHGCCIVCGVPWPCDVAKQFGAKDDALSERQRVEGIATTVERIHAVLKPGRPSHGLVGDLACILDHVSEAALEPR